MKKLIFIVLLLIASCSHKSNPVQVESRPTDVAFVKVMIGTLDSVELFDNNVYAATNFHKTLFTDSVIILPLAIYLFDTTIDFYLGATCFTHNFNDSVFYKHKYLYVTSDTTWRL